MLSPSYRYQQAIILTIRCLAILAFLVVGTGLKLGAQDTRSLTEPQFPPSCLVLTANQVASSLNEGLFDTARVQTAINSCPAGQAVELQAQGGNDAFLIQPISLAPGVTLLVDAGVTVFASLNPNDYACDDSTNMCLPLIGGQGAAGAGVMGYGIIDGRGGQPLLGGGGMSWWVQGDPRPRLIDMEGADNFTLYKITLQNSPEYHFWGGGNNLTVWGVKVTAPGCDQSTYTPSNNIPLPSTCLASPNTDGIDPSVELPGTTMNNVTITNSYISDGDDHIALKGGKGPITNVTISNNHLYTGHGVSIGSETNAGVNHVLVTNVAMDGAWGESQNGLRIKSDSSRGGEVYDVDYENICIVNGGHPLVFDPYYSSSTGTLYPNFHDITMHNVHLLNRQDYPTFRGYDTNNISFPLTMTLNNVQMDGYFASDFDYVDGYGPKVGNATFMLGPDPVSFASALQSLGTVGVNNEISDNNAAYNCTGKFIYLAGELVAPQPAVTAGQPLTLTAIVQPIVYASTAPTGTVTIFDNGAQVANTSISLPVDSYFGSSPRTITHLTIPTVSAGAHNYTAQYSGDGNYAALSFGALAISSLSGGNAQSTTALSSSATQVAVGGAVTLTAAVHAGSGNPSGSVVFFDNLLQLGPAVALNSSGTAQWTTSSLTLGVHNISATYGGGAGFSGSSSTAVTVSIVYVAPAPTVATTTMLAASATQIEGGTAVTFTASVGSSGGAPTGSVAFLDNGNSLGSAPLNSADVATLATSSLGPGTNNITGVYSGDAVFMASTSNVQTVTVSGTCHPPVPQTPALATVPANGAVAISLSATVGEYCGSNDGLTYTLVTAPVYGHVSIAGAIATYVPLFGYSGSDSFSFEVTDVNASPTTSAPVIVSIMILANGPKLMPNANGQTVLAGSYSAGFGGDGGPALWAMLNGPRKIAVDSFGNIFIADMNNYVVREVNAASGIITTVAGNNTSGTLSPGCNSAIYGSHGNGCLATQVYLASPRGVAVDAQGNLFISDESKSMIRRVDAVTGIITTAAGTGSSGYSGDNAAATSAKIKNPEGLRLDLAGNLYIADSKNYVVRKVNTAGVITTVAGTGVAGYSGDNGPATKAKLNVPMDVSVDAAGNVYIADSTNYVIREVSAATGQISTIAGTGSNAFNGIYEGWATQVNIVHPVTVVSDAAGNLYIGDGGTGDLFYYDAATGWLRPVNGQSEGPYAVALDALGNVYYGDYYNYIVDELPTGAQVGSATLNGGNESNGWVHYPSSIAGAISTLGNANFSQYSYQTGMEGDSTADTWLFLEFAPSTPGLATSTLDMASTGRGVSESRVALSGQGQMSWAVVDPGTVTILDSELNESPAGSTIDGSGSLYVADASAHVIWKFDSSGNRSVVAGIQGQSGYNGDGAAATQATLNAPRAVAVDGAGDIYIADTGNNVVRRVDAISGWMSTASTSCLWPGQSTTTALRHPSGLAADVHGNIYIADTGNNRVCRIDPLFGSTVAAAGGAASVCSGASDQLGDGCVPLQATLNAPAGLAVDAIGDLFIADSGDGSVREVNLATGLITSVGAPNNLISPTGVAVDAAGDAYFADSGNHTVGFISAASGAVNTLAGQAGTPGTAGTSGNSATSFQLNAPDGLAVDASGNLYISDAGNDRILRDNRSSASLQFGSVSGSQTANRNITLSNAGNLFLGLSWPLQTGNSAFTVPSNGACANGLTPGASCALEVIFQPYASGTITDTLTVGSNGGNSPQILLAGTGTNVVAPATVTLSCGPYGYGYYYYDGTSHACAATATGLGGVSVNGTMAITYNGSAVPPSNAGYYTVVASFTSSDPNWGNGSAATWLEIYSTYPSMNVFCPTVTYDGNPHSCTASATGINGAAVAGSYISYPASETVVGSYFVEVDFSSSDPDYYDDWGYGQLIINPATPVLTISCPTVAYDGAAHGCTATAAGASGAAVKGSFVFSPASETESGNYLVYVMFTSSDPDYISVSQSSPLVITPGASAQTTTTLGLSCPTVPYDSAPQGCTGSATNAGGASVSGTWSYIYSGSGYGPSTNPPSAIGTYTVEGTFSSSDPKYTGGSVSGTLTITVPPPPVSPTLYTICYPALFDGQPHGCAVIVTGANGEVLPSSAGSIVTNYYGNNYSNGIHSYYNSPNPPSAAGAYQVQVWFESNSSLYYSNYVWAQLVISQPASLIAIDPGTLSIPQWAAQPNPVNPQGLATDAWGDLLLADTANNSIEWSWVNPSAGGNLSNGQFGTAMFSALNSPQALTVDPYGDIYVADTGSGTVQEWDGGLPDAVADGLNGPRGIVADADGNLYVADTGNNLVKFVDTNSGNTLIVAGGGVPCSSATDAVGDGCPATQAVLNGPVGLTTDAYGNLYIADAGNSVVRKVTVNPANPMSSVITTVAGTVGALGTSGEGGPAISAELNNPLNLVVDPANNLYIVDSGNNAVRLVDASGNIHTWIGTLGTAGSGGADGGSATALQLNAPTGIALDMYGNIYLADTGNGRTIEVNRMLVARNSGDVMIGQTGPAITSTITNIGSASLNFQSPWEAEMNPGEFAINGQG